MLAFNLSRVTGGRFRILCLGAHCDDIEIGCGGSLLRLSQSRKDIEIYWAVFSSGSERKSEAEASAQLFLRDASRSTVKVHEFRESFFPYQGQAIKEFFELLGREYSPDLIFTHFGRDRHQDHRTVSELTWNTFRDHLILEYEIPKYDGDLGSPNCYIDLDESTCERKIDYIMECFRSQRNRPWFTRDTFRALLRLRGIESRSTYAEGFYCRKFILDAGRSA